MVRLGVCKGVLIMYYAFSLLHPHLSPMLAIYGMLLFTLSAYVTLGGLFISVILPKLLSGSK